MSKKPAKRKLGTLQHVRAEFCPDGSYWLHDDENGTYAYRRAEDSWLPEGWSWRRQWCAMLPDETDVQGWVAWDDESEGQCWYDGIDYMKMDFYNGEHEIQVRDAVRRANKEIFARVKSAWNSYKKKVERRTTKDAT